MTELELRGLFVCFLFSGDDADKKIKILSGGEKARVALAKTIVSKANFLMLDEPTNHLDMHSCDLLIDALNKYEGTIILVSHDRYFISKTANKIWEIVDHEIKEFKGGYEEWVAWKERMEKAKNEKKTAAQQAQPAIAPVAEPKQTTKPVNNKPQSPAPINKEAKKELQKWQREFQQLEEQIAKLNSRKNELEASLSNPNTYSDKNKFLETENAYKKAQDELKQLNSRYEIVFEKIMTLESKN